MDFEVLGLRETYAMIESLTAKDQQRVLLSVMTNAANINIKNNLQQGNPFSSSKKSTKPKFVTIKDKNNPLGVVSGVSSNFFYYRFLEYGTKQRKTKGYKIHKIKALTGRARKIKVMNKMANRGVMPKKPFAKGIIEGNLNNVVNYFIMDFGAKTANKLKALARKK